MRKTDAERFLTSVSHGILSGSYVDPEAGRTTVADQAAVWIAGRAHLKPKTLHAYRNALSSRVLPRWGSTQLARVTTGDVQSWVADMLGEGLSAATVRKMVYVLKAVLGTAVRDRRLVTNPVAEVDLPRLRQAERRYLTHEQVTRLAEACGPHRPLVLVLAYCGLRWGEATALRVKRLDLLRRRIEVAEAVSDVGGRLILGTPKSHQARSVPVPRFLVDELAEHLAGKAPDDLVFASPEGGLLRNGNFRRRTFDRAATEVGLDGLVPHELRHTAASLAIASGASVKGVQRMLGHASATMTLDLYGHLFDDELDAVADRLDAAAASARVPRTCPEATVVPLTQRETGS